MKKRVVFASIVTLIAAVFAIVRAIPKIKEWRILARQDRMRSAGSC